MVGNFNFPHMIFFEKKNPILLSSHDTGGEKYMKIVKIIEIFFPFGPPGPFRIVSFCNFEVKVKPERYFF